MIKKTLVSVVIPVYNMEDYLEETVNSVLQSTYPNIEIILMDDGSSDKSPLIGKKLSEQHPSIFFYSQTNKGVAAARNHAISLAKGEYIFPLDSDDLIGPDFFESAVKVLDTQDDVKVVYSRMMFIGEKNSEWILPDFSLSLIARKNIIPVSALFRKSDWIKAGGYCETIIAREDWEFWISVLKDGGKVVKLPCIGLYYRIRPNSKRMTDRKLKKHVIETLNNRHADFFLRELHGPLRQYRSWSRMYNRMTNLFCKKSVSVNPDFKHLTTFLNSLPFQFDKMGTTIYKGRNELKMFAVDGDEYIVKSYKRPIWINRIIYGFLRASKAQRAYDNAFKLLKAGIKTPLPVAYIEYSQNWLFDKSYFVSKKSSCPFEYRDLFKQTFQNETSILKAIARTTAMLHENGFLHKDYSGGNILFKETDGEIQVEIIDLNRMSFGKINMRTGCKNFERLNGNEHIYTVLGEEYANVRGFDKEKCIRLILEATRKQNK